MLSRRQFLAAAALAAGPDEWAQFLGPRRDGVSLETGLNTDWNAKRPAVAWKAPVGAGFSSVSIAGGRLYTMAKRGERDGAACLDAATGREIWFRDLVHSFLDRQRQGPGPRSTPTFHQGRLYCLMAAGELFCLDAADGREVWRVDLLQAAGSRPRDDMYYWGQAGSPLVEADAVIVQPGGSRNNSLVALHRETGKSLWSAGNDPAGYSSPVAIEAGGRRQVVSFTGQAAIGVDPAKGGLLWRYELANKFDCNIATPLWSDGLLFLSAAYGAGCAALEVSARAVREKWRNKNLLNHFPTSVILKGHVYGCHGDLGANQIRCLDLATGELKWDDRGPGKSSLLAYQEHIVLQGERGTARLIEANPDRYVEKGRLDGVLSGKAWSQPALLNQRLYLKDDREVVCLDLS
jgi:outer membrane protein assembly factor BamB